MHRWYPEVGRAPPPDLHKVRRRTEHVNRNYNPKSAKRWLKLEGTKHQTCKSAKCVAKEICFTKFIYFCRKVEIFNDKEYLKEMKSRQRSTSRRRKKKGSDDESRPRSLGDKSFIFASLKWKWNNEKFSLS